MGLFDSAHYDLKKKIEDRLFCLLPCEVTGSRHFEEKRRILLAVPAFSQDIWLHADLLANTLTSTICHFAFDCRRPFRVERATAFHLRARFHDCRRAH